MTTTPRPPAGPVAEPDAPADPAAHVVGPAADHRPDHRTDHRTDHRPGRRAGVAALVVGGVLYAVGNALHPLEHTDAATRSPTWAAAHLVFGLGALLIALGLPALAARLAASRVGIAGLVATAVGMVFVVGSVYDEVVIAPAVGHGAMDAAAEGAAAFGLLMMLTVVLGPVAVAAVGLAHRVLPAPACVGIVLAQVAMIASTALPGPEGLWVIPATVVFGLAVARLGLAVRRDVLNARRAR